MITQTVRSLENTHQREGKHEHLEMYHRSKTFKSLNRKKETLYTNHQL